MKRSEIEVSIPATLTLWGLVEAGRGTFDFAECESELVAGVVTEVSSLAFLAITLLEYGILLGVVDSYVQAFSKKRFKKTRFYPPKIFFNYSFYA